MNVKALSSRLLAMAVLVLAAMATGPLQADDDALEVELNKLEPADDACRAYLVIKNGMDNAFTKLKLDLVMFDGDGVVARRLAVEAAPLAAEKTVLKVFSMSGLECDSLSRVLLNDVIACADPSGTRTDCVDRMKLSSKTDVDFIK